MKIKITRYYGDANITLGRMTVEGTDLECETRELRFCDYSEAFPGCSNYCLPTGTFKCGFASTCFSPLTLVVKKSPGHRSTAFGWSATKRVMVNSILMEREAFERMQRMVERAYCESEEVWVEVENEDGDPPRPSL